MTFFILSPVSATSFQNQIFSCNSGGKKYHIERVGSLSNNSLPVFMAGSAAIPFIFSYAMSSSAFFIQVGAPRLPALVV